MLSYGTDVALLVEGRVEGESGVVTRVLVQRGVLVRETEMREVRTYTVRNEDSEPRTVIVEHPDRPDWKLTSGALPEETAPGAHRFRVDADAGETTTLEVAETRPLSRRFALSDVTDDHVTMLVEQGVSREALEGALRPILDQ